MSGTVTMSFTVVRSYEISSAEVDADALTTAIAKHAPEWSGWTVANALDDLANNWPDRFVAVVGAAGVSSDDPTGLQVDDYESDAAELTVCADCGEELDDHCAECGECECTCDQCEECGEDPCVCDDEDTDDDE